MFRRTLLAALVACTVAAPALAADDAPTVPDDHSVALSPVALPIVVDGQVLNYIFVTVKVLLTPRADEFALRDKEPFFRDALVRDAYRTPFLAKGDFNRVDENRLKAALFRDASAIAGPGNVRGVEVVSQTAQHFVRQPQPIPH
jgi:hypothetical protein